MVFLCMTSWLFQLVLENKDLKFSLAETRAELKQVKMVITFILYLNYVN